MKTSLDPRHLFCPEVERNVCIDCREGKCRDVNGCVQPACPLAGEFQDLATPPLIDAMRGLSRS